jgi:hypothetical protein
MPTVTATVVATEAARVKAGAINHRRRYGAPWGSRANISHANI